LAGWLHGVAYRTAMKAKRSAARRRNHERNPVSSRNRVSELADPSWQEVRAALDEEIQRLPAHHRSAFVACILEGKSVPEAAAELASKAGTVSSWLARARTRLRQRLARRGIELSALLAALAVAESAEAGMPTTLAQETVRFGLLVAAGRSAAGVIPSHIAALAAGVTRAMFLTKAKIAFAALLVAAVAAATGLAFVSAGDEPKQPNNANAQADSNLQAKEDPKTVVTVEGRVLDPAGKPFSGAKLYLRHQKMKEPEYVVRATSDKDGNYSFTFKRSILDNSIPEASWIQVIAVGDGFGADWSHYAKPAAQIEASFRLVKDVPIGGRILDVNGRPVKGAKLRIEYTEAWADTEVFLQSVRDREWPKVGAMNWSGPFPGQLATFTTDADGRFRLTGVGQDRVVRFQVQGPNIQWGPMRAMAREMKAPVEPRKVRFAEGPAFDPVYPATFDHVFQPSRLIRGVVRDKKTGRPTAGIRVDGYGTTDSAVTDAEGRFMLDGFGKSAGGAYGMGVRPPGEKYFSRSASFPDTPGLGPIDGEIELVSGIVVKGRVTHYTTGKPIAGARVEYNPLVPNPFVRWFGPNGAGTIPCSYTTSGSDGSYSIVVLPGPGVLGFTYGTGTETFMPALLTAQDLREFFKDEADRESGENILRIQMTENGHNAISQVQFNHLLLIKPAETDEALTRDVTLQPAKPLKGKVVGPDGKPFLGATAYSLSPGILCGPLADDTFTVQALNPRRGHELLFITKDRKLGAFLTLKGAIKEPLTVRLEPCGSVSGRLLDQDGEPVANAVVRLDVTAPYDSGPPKVKTDSKGRFRFEGIVPGQSHQARFGPPPFGQYLYKPFTLKPGENKDLGDVEVKPKS
jgi:protocatechuate 3,4-dioxygenase beta subunit